MPCEVNSNADSEFDLRVGGFYTRLVLTNYPAVSESGMWLYASAAHLRHQIRLFEYQPDRSGRRAEAFLKGGTGYLVTDGHAGYNHVQNVTRCG